MPGPRRTPAHVLTARGSTWPTEGHGDVRAATPVEIPPPPDWLPPPAKARYVEVAEFLRAAGALATSDLPVIVRYCVTWAKWAAAEQRLAAGEEPEFIQTSGRYGDRVVPSAASARAPRRRGNGHGLSDCRRPTGGGLGAWLHRR